MNICPAGIPGRITAAPTAPASDLGGGVVNTLSHPIDYLRWLLGEVSYVTALMTSSGGLEMDVEDTGTLLLEFDSGVHGVVHLNYNQRPPRGMISRLSVRRAVFAGITAMVLCAGGARALRDWTSCHASRRV